MVVCLLALALGCVGRKEERLAEVELEDGGVEFVEDRGVVVDVDGRGCTRTRDGVVQCRDLELREADQFCAGSNHACALVGERVICIGDNSAGQLGLGHHDAIEEPQVIEALSSIERIECGDEFSCALTRAGSVWCWGDNQDGRLGQPESIAALAEPTQVPDMFDVRGLRTYFKRSCVVHADASLACWGRVTPDMR